MLSDTHFRLADALNPPTFHSGGVRLYKRLTLVVRDGRIEHVFYPCLPARLALSAGASLAERHPLTRSFPGTGGRVI